MTAASGGRPSKLDEDVVKRVLNGVQMGLSFRNACRAGGITYQTFRTWQKKAERVEAGEAGIRNGAEYVRFLDRLREAEAQGALRLLGKIQQAANEGHWSAAAWILERRHKEDYGAKQTVEHEGTWDGGPVELVLRWTDVPGEPRSGHSDAALVGAAAGEAEEASLEDDGFSGATEGPNAADLGIAPPATAG